MQFKFNDFIPGSKRFEYSHNGSSSWAEPQIIELLLLLIQGFDRMVSKDEINEKVCKGRMVSESVFCRAG